MKKLLIVFILGLFFFSIVSAIPPQTAVNTNVGIDIRIPTQEIIKANTSIDFHIHVYNKTDGLLLTSITTDCFVHLFNDVGNHILKEEMSFDETDFKLEINDSIIGVGEYSYIVWCNATDIGGFISGSVIATHSGLEFTDIDRNILMIAIIFLLLIGGLFFVGFIKEDKMQVKWSLFIIAFIFFLAGLNTISVMIYDNIISTVLINFFDSFTGIMFTAFWVLFALLAVMWFLTLLQAILFKKSMKQASKFGSLMK